MDAFSFVAGHATSPAWHTSMPSEGASTPSKPNKACPGFVAAWTKVMELDRFDLA
jgi:hypothetical protein